MVKNKTKTEAKPKTSVRFYKEGIKAEKQKFATYSKRMRQKVEGFKEEIRNQIKKNKEAVSKIGAGVKFLISEIDKKKSNFQAYAHGPFKNYINEF